jgi:hypothetical protein
LGTTADEIKQKMVRFLTTFNVNADQQQDIILEDRTEEVRERAYSQEMIDRNDRSELIDTKTVQGRGYGGYALS